MFPSAQRLQALWRGRKARLRTQVLRVEAVRRAEREKRWREAQERRVEETKRAREKEIQLERERRALEKRLREERLAQEKQVRSYFPTAPRTRRCVLGLWCAS